MKILLLLGLLVILHKQAWCKPAVEHEKDPELDELDYGLQQDEYDYDDDSNDNEENEEADELPTFTSKPLHLSAKMHSDVSLPCDMSGNAETYTIMWKKNNEIIFQEKHIFASFDSKKFVLVNTTTLTIKDVDASDAGEYSCVVIISSDKEEALMHTVTVQSPAKITSLTADKNVLEYTSGDKIELTCVAAGHPEAKISWSFHGKHLGSGPKLIMENIKHDNSGDYQCLADSGVNPVDHRSIHIQVSHKPVVSLEKITTNFNGDEYDVELRCSVRSHPPAIVVWRKDGEELKKKIRSKNNVQVLHLSKVDSKQFGRYSCKAENQIGSNEEHIMVTNAPSRAVYKSGHDENRNEFNLTWEVESVYPITEYVLEYKKISDDKWMEEKPDVTNSESGTLYVINHVLKNLDSGDYEVRVRSKNQWGWSEYSNLTTFKAHQAHKSGHKKQHNQHKTKPLDHNKEDNNVALETRVGGSTSSSVLLLPTTSLLCLAALSLFNRH